MPEFTDPVAAAARTLYALPPDEFLTQRAQLSGRARSAGDAPSARSIDQLRKPTVAAWIVNAFVLDDQSVAAQLIELGGRLRAAQDALDPVRLRDLSVERRTLIARLTQDALRRADRRRPSTTLRDEVTGTLDAAVADADIAGRLGRLVRAEHWSGFGFAPSGTPELTLVRGGRDDDAVPTPTPKPPRVPAAIRRKQERELSAAKNAFDAAETAYDTAREAELDLSQQIRRLTKKLSRVQGQLDEARDAVEAARKDAAAARTRRREARSALDRAEREAGA